MPRGYRITAELLNAIREVVRQTVAEYQNSENKRSRWFNAKSAPAVVMLLGKSTVDVAQGATGTFELYDLETQTKIDPEQTEEAKVLLGPYVANRWAYILDGHVINTQCVPCQPPASTTTPPPTTTSV